MARTRNCAVVAALAALIVSASPRTVPFSAAAAVDTLIETAISEGKLPGAVLLVGHNGEVVYRKAYGHRALLPSAEPMTADTIFDCASLTKVIATTSSVMKLFEAGKIRLSDPVTNYIPEFQGGKSDITVRDLMTHFSGFRPDFDLEPPFSGYAAGIERAAQDPPVGPPESKFVYSDTNFILMGEIVHRVSGQMLDEFAQANVFGPLGMTDTRFRPPAGLLPRIAPTESLATGEFLRGIVHDPRARLMGGVAGHAGIFSTADDLARFCQMMLDKGVNPAADSTHPARFASPLTIDLFTSNQSPPGATAIRGLGWDINSAFSGARGELFPVGTSYGHTGFTGTSVWIDPSSHTYVILLANAVHPKAGKNITPLRKSVATAVAAAVGYPRKTTKHVRTGLDVLEDEHFRSLAGKRVGLITNQTGIDRNGRRNVDVMREAGVRVTALFAPEHGILGSEDKAEIAATTDKATGIHVYSLYSLNSKKNQRPTAEMLSGLDVLVFDIADIGTRFYTYETTMAYAMEECARAHLPFVVLDRPDPITGRHVEGPVLDLADRSFVGYFPLPLRHGMTMGELALMFNTENKINAPLTVVRMLDWDRGDWFDSTGLPWVDPSPNIRNLNAALLYPGVAMLEYSENYSVGRGTREPFEVIGAKWMHAEEMASYLNGREIPGVRAYPVRFRPDSNHLAGTMLDGVRFVVTNRDIFDAARFGLEIATALSKLYPGQIRFDASRRLIGNDETVEQLQRQQGDANAITASEEPRLEAFRALRERYLLYR